MDCSTPGLPVHHQLPELAQTHVHRVSDAFQWSHPLSFPSPPAFNLSQHQGLSSESALRIRWPKYWSFSVSISPSNEYSGLISFRIDWFDFAVQGTLKSLLQHHSSKATILWCSAFFTVQLSHPYMRCHLHIWGYWYFSRQSWFQLVVLPAQRFSWCTLLLSRFSRVCFCHWQRWG